MQIPVFSTDNMELDAASLGLQRSPTKVVKIDTPKVTRGGTVVKAGDAKASPFYFKNLEKSINLLK